MSTERDLAPKQQRSLDTQKNLLKALHICLADKFFEHISIKDIADTAGVSVGTFYRRFKDKESLLPLLYQDFGHDLMMWVTAMESEEYQSLHDALVKMVSGTYVFLLEKESVFRTLHLNSRLHSEILASDKVVNRDVVYQKLSAILMRYDKEIGAVNKSQANDICVYMMVNTLLDKVLYPGLTPATACSLTAAEFTKELPEVLFAYLVKS
ncbi:Regulatory protein, TetR [Shewanella piezotolerans WP3]|uniref:Regulatory protein, TetR n=1 Tax=Shewanella piezotolerans (strain WP3 / JCM 13877) TaxID=225849 RepID=B8CQC0_SHEPW|nr:TetR/AcrR family transcriptional regulator [Shewanella piezotolerans]ACJ30250.1 Regulatory protein, TetR [Shewanella piezotolerans WP3]